MKCHTDYVRKIRYGQSETTRMTGRHASCGSCFIVVVENDPRYLYKKQYEKFDSTPLRDAFTYYLLSADVR